MTEYRYLCARILTNEIIAELPFTGVTYGQELNTAGTFSGKLLLSDPRMAAYNVIEATEPTQIALYIERNGQLVWGGIIWTRMYSPETQELSIGAKEFESYFDHRVVQFGIANGIAPRTYNFSGSWNYNTDIFKVVEDCFVAVRDWLLPNSDIGITIPSNTLGVTVGDISNQYGYVINDFEFRPLMDVISQLSKQAAGQGGFDYNVDVAYDNDYNITKTLELSAKRGTPYSTTNAFAPVLSMPGNIVTYEWPEDGTRAANTVYGVGNGSGTGSIWYNNPLLDTIPELFSIASGPIDAGAPILEKTFTAANEPNPIVVGRQTSASAAASQYPVTIPTVTWDSINDPQIGSFKTGDEFRIIIQDDRFPDGLDMVMRMTRFDVDAGEDGPERITASFVSTDAFA